MKTLCRIVLRVSLFVLTLSACSSANASPVFDQAKTTPSAAVELNELGPENGEIARLVGLWDVTETVWATPTSVPMVTNDLIAERKMVGSILQETLRSSTDSSAKILRIDYLSFNRVEGRWEYVSMDTRAAVGIMTAQSNGRETTKHIVINFQPLALTGRGLVASGQMLRIRQEIISGPPGRSQKDQYFMLADGTSTEWLAHRYAYTARGHSVPASTN